MTMGESGTVTLRPIEQSDGAECARIVYEAFKGIGEKRGFPLDFPVPEAAEALIGAWLAQPKVWGVVAERDGRVVGSNFLDQRTPVAGVGPITVDPGAQAGGVGRRLMEAVMERGGDKPIRLVQDAHNTVSMSLYTLLGFDIKEPLVRLDGDLSGAAPAGDTEVRPFEREDLDECRRLSVQVHGFDRTAELEDALSAPIKPYVGTRDGRIVSYATSISYWPIAHGVAESNVELQTLIMEVHRQTGDPVSFLMPIRNAELFRWALRSGLQIVKPMSLMAIGDYQEPSGAWFPSVEF